MKTIERKPLKDQADQLRNDALRHQRDDDMRDDDMLTDSHIADSKLPKHDNTKENNDLNDTDLEDTEQADLDVHHVKKDKFGSLGRTIKNEAEPDPDEIPEEHEADNNKEVDYPDDDRMEQGKDDEVNYKEPKEVTPPSPESKPDTKNATLGDVDSTFTDDKHGRTSGRMLDHEPGSGINPPEHGAYNL